MSYRQNSSNKSSEHRCDCIHLSHIFAQNLPRPFWECFHKSLFNSREKQALLQVLATEKILQPDRSQTRFMHSSHSSPCTWGQILTLGLTTGSAECRHPQALPPIRLPGRRLQHHPTAPSLPTVLQDLRPSLSTGLHQQPPGLIPWSPSNPASSTPLEGHSPLLQPKEKKKKKLDTLLHSLFGSRSLLLFLNSNYTQCGGQKKKSLL